MVEDFPPFLTYRSYVQELVSTFDLDNVVNYNTSTMYCLTHISLKNIKDSWERERKRERAISTLIKAMLFILQSTFMGFGSWVFFLDDSKQ